MKKAASFDEVEKLRVTKPMSAANAGEDKGKRWKYSQQIRRWMFKGNREGAEGRVQNGLPTKGAWENENGIKCLQRSQDTGLVFEILNGRDKRISQKGSQSQGHTMYVGESHAS